MTISLVAVFIPVLFLGGIIGRLLREFSITIAVAVLISGVISLTLTPMLCSRFLHHESHPRNAFYRISEKFFVWLNDFYRRTLLTVLHHRRITLGVSVLLTVAAVYMFVVMPKGFMPSVDQGIAFGGDEAAQDASFDEMVRLQSKVNDVLAKNPWVETFGSGVGGFTGQNQGFAFVALKDDPHRPKHEPAEALPEIASRRVPVELGRLPQRPEQDERDDEHESSSPEEQPLGNGEVLDPPDPVGEDVRAKLRDHLTVSWASSASIG